MRSLGGEFRPNREVDEIAWVKASRASELLTHERDHLVVAGVTEFGLFVDLTGYYVQGLLHISELGNDYYIYHPRTQALVGERSGRAFGLGDKLDVVIRDIEPPQGKIDLELARRAERGAKRKGKRRRR